MNSVARWGLLFCLLCCSVGAVFAAPPDAWRFVVIADTQSPDGADPGYNQEILGELRSAIVSEAPDFVLVAGNLVSAGTTAQLRSWCDFFMAPLQAHGIAVYPCRGMTEASAVATLPAVAPTYEWNTAFSGNYALPQNGPAAEKGVTYSFTNRDATVLVLDEFSTGITWHLANAPWALDVLSRATTPHAFILGHFTDIGAFDASFCQRNGVEAYFGGYERAFVHRLWNRNFSDFACGLGGAEDLGPPELHPSDPNLEIVAEASGYGYVLVEVSKYEVTTVYKNRKAPGVYLAAVPSYTHSDAYLVRPKARFAADSEAGPTTLDVAFHDLSTCPDGTISNWLWTFGDGTSSTEQHPVHTYASPGIYEVSLTASSEYAAGTIRRAVFTGGQPVPAATPGGLVFGVGIILAVGVLLVRRVRSGEKRCL